MTSESPVNLVTAEEISYSEETASENASAELPDALEIPVTGSHSPRNWRPGPPRVRAALVRAAPGDPCEEVAAPLSEEECAGLQRQLAGARDRMLDLIAPSPMYRGRDSRVRAILRRSDRPDDDPPGETTVRASRQVSATGRMKARLTGDGFAITPEGWVSQPLGLSREGEWEWQVRPTRESGGRLEVVVVPQLTLPDGRTIDVEPYRKAIDVEVRVLAGDRAEAAAEGLDSQSRSWAKALGGLTLLLGALTGIVLAWRKLRSALQGGRAAKAKPAAERPEPTLSR